MSVIRPVVVMQLPELLNTENAQAFREEVRPLFESHRPRIVLDCSVVRTIEGAGIEMLLECLEEAMKRDGDVKLCALSPETEVILELMRVGRVFEVFRAAEDAVRSFNAVPADAISRDASWHTAVFGDLGAVKQAG